jgi:hypothetical protein
MASIVIRRADAVLFKGIVEALLKGAMNQEMAYL